MRDDLAGSTFCLDRSGRRTWALACNVPFHINLITILMCLKQLHYNAELVAKVQSTQGGRRAYLTVYPQEFANSNTFIEACIAAVTLMLHL